MKIKVKVKLFVYLIKYSIVKTDGIVEVLLNTFLSLVLDRADLTLSCPSHYTSWERNAITYWMVSLVDPRGHQYAVEKRRIYADAGDSADISQYPD